MLIADTAAPSNTQAQTKHPAITFLTSIFEPDDRVCIAAKKTVGEGFQTDFRAVKEICTEDYLNKLAEKNDAGLNIYVCMNAVRAGATRRRKEDIGEIRSVYLDLDADGQRKLDVIMSSKDVPTPTIVQESSTGKFLWRYRAPSHILWYPEVSDNLMYVRLYNGTMNVLRISDGKDLWHYPFPSGK